MFIVGVAYEERGKVNNERWGSGYKKEETDGGTRGAADFSAIEQAVVCDEGSNVFHLLC